MIILIQGKLKGEMLSFMMGSQCHRLTRQVGSDEAEHTQETLIIHPDHRTSKSVETVGTTDCFVTTPCAMDTSLPPLTLDPQQFDYRGHGPSRHAN